MDESNVPATDAGQVGVPTRSIVIVESGSGRWPVVEVDGVRYMPDFLTRDLARFFGLMAPLMAALAFVCGMVLAHLVW